MDVGEPADYSTWSGDVSLTSSINESVRGEVARVWMARPIMMKVQWRYDGPSVGATVVVWAGLGRTTIPYEVVAPSTFGSFAVPAREVRVELVLDPSTPTTHRLRVGVAPYAW